jgi:hypothetical protein
MSKNVLEMKKQNHLGENMKIALIAAGFLALIMFLTYWYWYGF